MQKRDKRIREMHCEEWNACRDIWDTGGQEAAMEYLAGRANSGMFTMQEAARIHMDVGRIISLGEGKGVRHG